MHLRLPESRRYALLSFLSAQVAALRTEYVFGILRQPGRQGNLLAVRGGSPAVLTSASTEPVSVSVL